MHLIPSKYLLIILFLLPGIFYHIANSQDIEGDMVYSVDILANPAFSGASGAGSLKLLYRDFFPGNNMNLNTIYLSYDSYLEPVQGGIGFYMIENKLGDILNDFRSGVSYAYHLRAGNDLYINAGFMASVIYRSINRNLLVFPDQIDPILGPVLPSGEIIDFRSRLLFDVGVGFLISYRTYNTGISFGHLGKPDLIGRGVEDGRLKRRVTIHGDAEFATVNSKLLVKPLFFANFQDQFVYGAVGSCLSYKPLTISMMLHFNSSDVLYAMQAGFSFETGRFSIGYSYFFDAFRIKPGLPLTHSNLVSVSISLNNVDNSGVLKAINYPKL